MNLLYTFQRRGWAVPGFLLLLVIRCRVSKRVLVIWGERWWGFEAVIIVKFGGGRGGEMALEDSQVE